MKKKVFVAGHNGMVGAALVRQLAGRPDIELVLRTRSDLDLTKQNEVARFFEENKIDEVYLAAAKVGGIYANNTYPADFIYDNLAIQNNVINSAHSSGVQKLLFLGSSCIYPRLATQPMDESELLTGPLEPTNEPYAIAKIAGIKMCESYNRQYGTQYRSVMPTNLYGPNDNFHPENSHVIPALIRRIHSAKVKREGEVIVWGTGKPRREFLHVDDMASASIYIMELDREKYESSIDPRMTHINVGTGQDCSIAEIVEIMIDAIGYEGKIIFDTSKPDGPPRKLLNTAKINQLGWKPHRALRDGLLETYNWFVNSIDVRM